MWQNRAKSASVRFGAFELDAEAGELRKNGVKIALQEQPFRVLTVLLEQPGSIVTREDLQQRLWPEDTFVEFDRGLNTAINKVREALGDSANSPRFIETLPRRGYRFIAPVERGDGKRSERKLPAWVPVVAAALATAIGVIALEELRHRNPPFSAPVRKSTSRLKTSRSNLPP